MNKTSPHLLVSRGHFALAGSFLLLGALDASAYIDPGTGSYFFQIAVAGLLAGAYTIRRYLALAAQFLRRRRSHGLYGRAAKGDL